MEKIKKENRTKKQKPDLYNMVLFCQIILSAILVTALVFLCKASPEVKRDYDALMQWDMSDEAVSAAAYIGEYFSSESAWAVNSSGVVTDEGAEETTAEMTTQDKTTQVYEETDGEKVSVKKTSLKKETQVDTKAVAAFSFGYGIDLDLYNMPEDYGLKDFEVSDEILNPIENPRYTSYFGYRIHPITGERAFHTGLDIAAAEGTKIRAAYSGRVTKTGEDDRAGKYIFLEHENGLVTFYCHCSEILAKKGANILQGETVAKVGSTGLSTGPHVHFEIRKDGEHLDPMKFLKK